jgi:hypothetical protein
MVAVLALVLGTAVPSLAASGPAATLAGPPVKTSLAGFSAGNIISDAVFTDSSTMTEAQIQAFFNSKVKTCRGGVDNYGPIVCLKDFRMDTVNRPADKYCKGYTGAAGESAARIIYRVSQSCNINPQVLIVMLQKEQSLVTHTWPSKWRYDAALGQGCPDGGVSCDPKFVGFFHQVYGAARQMQIYMEGVWFKWYAPGKTWNLLWHPPFEVSPGVWKDLCGSSPVYIANKATSALYYYTPYQPNASALAAGWGEGDSCASYGNRNFYNYFTDWFGSTQVAGMPGPGLASLNTSSFVTAIDDSGDFWAYPFAKSVWGSRWRLATGVTGVKSALTVGDLDGDGQRDVLLWRGSEVSLMRGDGLSLSSPEKLPVDWSGVLLATAAGDLDHDGVPDVITTNATGDLMLWRGDDRGGLLPPTRIGWGWSGMNLIIGNLDLNRDGNSDLIGRDTAGRLWGFYGNGRGGWLSQQQLGQGWGGMSTIFTPGDYTGDGVADLVGRTAGGDLHLYPGNGVGSLVTGPRIGNGWQSFSSLSGAGVTVTKPRPPKTGAGDVDKDGPRDVVGVSTTGVLNLYRGDGAGAWRGVKQIGTGWNSTDRVVQLGDFNGDGYEDIGRVTANGDFFLYGGRASGGFAAPLQIGNGWGGFSAILGGIDFDGDRKPDVIVRDASGGLRLYRGNGVGGWVGDYSSIGYGWTAFDVIINAGDFDGDGKADLIVRTADKNLWLYPTDARGGWGSARQIGTNWSSFDILVSPGDFDGDGRVDVLARVTANGDLHLFRGDGKGGWLSSARIGNGWNALTSLG